MINTGVPVLLVVLPIVGLFIVGLITLVVVLLAKGRRPSPQTQASTHPSAATASPEERQAILKRLADGELTKAEAEEQLSQLGNPVPTAMPSPPSTQGGAGKGCLIAAILALGLFLFILLLVVAMHFFGIKRTRLIHRDRITNEEFQNAIKAGHRIEVREGREPVIIHIEENETDETQE